MANFARLEHNSILDLLDTIKYYYDSYSNTVFKYTFRKENEPAVRNFIMEICLYYPFISVLRIEEYLMQSITDVLENNNKSFGQNSLKQLSQGI